ncbi:MAG: hypothetical protein K9N21_19305 [Deltaproteobacteria bacterium]|nr:hypothetical protein [Deltaproteobacteria bacterium]
MMFEKHYHAVALIRLACICCFISVLLASCGDDKGTSSSAVDATRWYTEQRLDHFSQEETRTWKQRYFVNDAFFDGKGPVFLCVGGEGDALTPDVVQTGTVHCAVMVELAKQAGALILALEHRYYGESQPVSDLSTANLKWLTSRQALGDIAQFHAYISEIYNLKDDKKWVTFGGSYPGMLAAWARIKYPNLIFAAVSSSAPVEAWYNMEGFNNVMAQSMGATVVGGSEQCVEQIRSAFSDIGSLLGSVEGRQFLYDRFNLCTSAADPDPLKDEYNQFQFIYYLSTQDGIDLSGSRTGSLFPVQSNDPNCEEDACNIEKVCSDYMLNSDLGQPIDRLAGLWSLYTGGECTSVDYQTATIAPLLDTSLSSWPIRSWQYQACNEFGFFQTCDPGTECPFTQEPHINTVEICSYPCQRAFGIDASDIQERISETNAYYGGWNPVGTRIMYVSGSIDPWNSLGVCRTPDCQPLPEQPVLWVEGASHHFWTHAAGYYTPPLSHAVVQAQEAIKAQVLIWLEE